MLVSILLLFKDVLLLIVSAYICCSCFLVGENSQKKKKKVEVQIHFRRHSKSNHFQRPSMALCTMPVSDLTQWCFKENSPNPRDIKTKLKKIKIFYQFF